MTAWRKAARCGSGTCVEVAFIDDQIHIRDSKDPDGPVLRFTEQEWQAFVDTVHTGEFDLLT